MHLAEALMTRDEAVRMASTALSGYVDRCAAYFARHPDVRPDPARPRLDEVRAQDAWYFVPFDRSTPTGGAAVQVRVNALTKQARVDSHP